MEEEEGEAEGEEKLEERMKSEGGMARPAKILACTYRLKSNPSRKRGGGKDKRADSHT